METASSPHDFKLMLAAGGSRASGIEQVMESNGDVAASPRRPSRSGLKVSRLRPTHSLARGPSCEVDSG